ncbi:MAG: hypothetical protein JSS32_04175 [Verrucomicrobia bacterium]|nr:hypothetical protein [Verrucomicrobiota bacterium]
MSSPSSSAHVVSYSGASTTSQAYPSAHTRRPSGEMQGHEVEHLDANGLTKWDALKAGLLQTIRVVVFSVIFVVAAIVKAATCGKANIKLNILATRISDEAKGAGNSFYAFRKFDEAKADPTYMRLLGALKADGFKGDLQFEQMHTAFPAPSFQEDLPRDE